MTSDRRADLGATTRRSGPTPARTAGSAGWTSSPASGRARRAEGVRGGRDRAVRRLRPARDGRLLARAGGAPARVRAPTRSTFSTRRIRPRSGASRASLDLERTLFLVSSKSGSTLETRSHLEYFWERTGGRGAQFAAITDPGSELERLAQERGFRATFPGEPEIGGRYSALSLFGIVPASLMGVGLERFLDRARR